MTKVTDITFHDTRWRCRKCGGVTVFPQNAVVKFPVDPRCVHCGTSMYAPLSASGAPQP